MGCNQNQNRIAMDSHREQRSSRRPKVVLDRARFGHIVHQSQQ